MEAEIKEDGSLHLRSSCPEEQLSLRAWVARMSYHNSGFVKKPLSHDYIRITPGRVAWLSDTSETPEISKEHEEKTGEECKHLRYVKWFPKTVPVVVSGEFVDDISTIAFTGCLSCGKVFIENYGE